MVLMNRRYFLGAAASTALTWGAAPARRKVVVCLIDGFGPEYIARSEMPNLQRAMKSGTYKIGRGAMPSLTNVNSASLATGSYPESHGITANTFFDPELDKIVEMADAKYLKRPTLFASAHKKGWKTAFVGAKEKIRSLIGVGAHSSISAEKQGIRMYEAETTYWVFEQGRQALRNPDVDLLYLTTSDYIMHTHGPETAESLEHLKNLDVHLGRILDDQPKLELYLCADHGMNAKSRAVDPERLLAKHSISARAVPAIADKHKIHHKDLGGSIYIDLEKSADIAKAAEIFKAEPGIEEVLLRADACKRFRLMPERTGDLFLLGDKITAIGALDQERRPVAVRTHGSLHEAAVPLLVYGRKWKGKLETSVDLTAERVWEERA
jgi:phosphonoacetate hydrolase